MSDESASRSEQVREFYNQLAESSPEHSVLNYGYAPLDARAAGDAQPEGYCLALYAHVGDAQLRGARVLEVSCGRGGGTAFIQSTFSPASVTGIDLSEGNIALAKERFGAREGLEFRLGNAQSMPFTEASFDVVLNVEASHLYDDPIRFFAEVHRVLRPGGRFLYADLCWSSIDPAELLQAAGFEIASAEDITPNVLCALDLDSERRERIMRSTLPESQWDDFRDWSGIKGYRAYNRFASSEWVYRYYQLVRL